ncbi:unnamed protein product [Amoebophrya sp. A25]|nr:unnamed protein product [Amoebophrya sp. A25]|eukprot:GSA25T00007532001.1
MAKDMTGVKDVAVRAGLGDIVPNRYDALLVDQFGVLHDGNMVYEGVEDCLTELRRHPVKVVMLSNSTKRAKKTMQRMAERQKVSSDKIDGFVTSGELVWQLFHHVPANEDEDTVSKLGLGRKAFVFDVGDGYLPEFLEGLEGRLEFVDSIEDATLLFAFGYGAIADSKGHCVRKLQFTMNRSGSTPVVHHNTGSNGDGVQKNPQSGAASGCAPSSEQEGQHMHLTTKQISEAHAEEERIVDEILAKAAARNLPCLCANPDLMSAPRMDGTHDLVAGSLAARYVQKFGGRAIYYGKPHAVIYDEALAYLKREHGVPVETAEDKRRIAMVGDSLMHDICGAQGAGIDSIWLTGGVHYEALGIAPGPSCDTNRVDSDKAAREFARWGATPTWQVGGFQW